MYKVKFNIEELLQMVTNGVREIVADEIRKALTDAKNAPKKMYSREEACRVLHITIPTLWKWEKQGVINGVRVNRRVLFSEDEIARVLKQKGGNV